MTNRIAVAYLSEIKESDRLEPRYFYNQNILKESFEKYDFKKIIEISTIKSGSTPIHHTDPKSKEDFFLIKSADIKRYNLNLSTISYISNLTHQSRRNQFIYPNDVLLSNTGKYLGFACIVPGFIPQSTTNQNIIRIRFKEDEKILNPFFLMSFLNSKFGQIEIESLLTLTGQKYLNQEKFKEQYKIPIINEKYIKSITDKTEKIINCEVNSLFLLRKAQTIFYTALNLDFSKLEKENFYSVNLMDFYTSDLWTPAYSFPIYKNIIKEISRKHHIIKLGELANIKTGDEIGSDNYIKYLDKKDKDIPFIRTTDLVNYEVDQFPDFFTSEEAYVEFNQDIRSGDLLFTKDGKIGMCALVTENDKAILSSGIAKLRLKSESKKYNITPEYLFIVLSTRETGYFPAIRRTVIASTIPHLRPERLKEIEIPVLDKFVIDNITEVTSEAFKLKNEKKKLIKEVNDEINNIFNLK